MDTNVSIHVKMHVELEPFVPLSITSLFAIVKKDMQETHFFRVMFNMSQYTQLLRIPVTHHLVDRTAVVWLRLKIMLFVHVYQVSAALHHYANVNVFQAQNVH